MIVIGISGRRESGKDTLGNKLRDFYAHLHPRKKVDVRSTADWVKTLIHRFCGAPKEAMWGTDEEKCRPLPSNPDVDGREAARRLYTCVTSIDPACCIRYAIEEPRILGYDVLILPSVRNVIDVEHIQRTGGKVIRLTRAPHKEDTHKEEVELDDYQGFDHVIDNVGLEPFDTATRAAEYLRSEGLI